MSKDFSIIIPAYNEESFLQKTLDKIKVCIEAVSRDLKLEGEVIVVDNNSADNTAEIAMASGARVVFEPENCIARARNRGAQNAYGKFLIFVDADTLVSPELLNAVLSRLLSGFVCGGGTRIAFAEKKTPLAAIICLQVWHFLVKIFPCAAGSFIFCTKEAFEAVGGFNQNFYAAEEIVLSKALRLHGRKNRMRFEILEIPVETSARKFEWFGTSYLLAKALLVAILPFMLRKRKYCDIWYSRPQNLKFE